MGINLNVLSAVAGAAEQYTKNTGELKKELRENKRRQRDWLATYGSKALNENKQKQESVQSALDDLKSRGLDTPDAIQLLQKHGVGSVLELAKYVKEYEIKNNTSVDADLMNKLWTSADDFTTTETTFEAAVAKVFGTSTGTSTAPVIQEAEDRNFFDQLKYNMGDRYDDELEDFLTDSSEGIGDKSIRELRAMSASSPSMLGTDGSAVFDRSQLRGSESTTSERAQWKDLKGTILSNALNSLDPTVANKIRVMQGEITDISRSDDDQWNMLTATNAPEAYKEAIAEATRNAAEDIDLGGNRAAWNSYGGQNALDAILNPITLKEQLAEKGASEEETQLIVNNPFVKTDNTQADIEKIREFLEANPNLPYIIIDNKIMESEDFLSRSEEGGGEAGGEGDTTEPPVVITETSFDPDTYELLVQPEPDPVVEAKPEREVYTSGREKRSSKEARKDWMREYGNKYFNDGSKRYVSPRPTEEGEPQRLWDSLWGSTHDFETGFPLIEAGN